MAIRRINKELFDLEKDPESNVCVSAIASDDLFELQATLMGPQGTPYEGGIFSLNIDFTNDYPFKPPRVAFKTRIYHPNVDSNSGRICQEHGLSIICPDRWQPASSIRQPIRQVLIPLFAILHDPVLEGCIINQDANLNYKIASEWTRKYAQ